MLKGKKLCVGSSVSCVSFSVCVCVFVTVLRCVSSLSSFPPPPLSILFFDLCLPLLHLLLVFGWLRCFCCLFLIDLLSHCMRILHLLLF